MKKGGYKIIDFNGAALSGTAITRTDILASLKENYGKVILLTGILIGDNAMDDCFSTPLSDGDDGFKLNAYDGYISVTKAGAVTYTVAAESSIPGLISDVNKIKSNNTISITTITTFTSLLNQLELNESLFGKITNTPSNSIFGVNKTMSIIMTKITESGFNLFAVEPTAGYIYIARGTVTGTTLEWTGRYIFEGIAYTPTP